MLGRRGAGRATRASGTRSCRGGSAGPASRTGTRPAPWRSRSCLSGRPDEEEHAQRPGRVGERRPLPSRRARRGSRPPRAGPGRVVEERAHLVELSGSFGIEHRQRQPGRGSDVASTSLVSNAVAPCSAASAAVASMSRSRLPGAARWGGTAGPARTTRSASVQRRRRRASPARARAERPRSTRSRRAAHLDHVEGAGDAGRSASTSRSRPESSRRRG